MHALLFLLHAAVTKMIDGLHKKKHKNSLRKKVKNLHDHNFAPV